MCSVLAVTAHASFVRCSSGNWDTDVNPSLHGKVDVVVIRASETFGFNPVFMALDGVDSVVSLVITDRTSAERDDVLDTVEHAEFVWFAGGDQCM